VIFLLLGFGLGWAQQPTPHFGISISGFHLTRVDFLNSWRVSGSVVTDRDEIALFATIGRSDIRSENELGLQYRMHYKGFMQNSFALGFLVSYSEYVKEDDSRISKLNAIRFGPRSAYTWHAGESWFVRPQLGLDLNVGIFRTESDFEGGFLPFDDGSRAFPFLAPFIDFQLEIGWIF
jgi:hypothetical protein